LSILSFVEYGRMSLGLGRELKVENCTVTDEVCDREMTT
jgi:hypothetical protein